MTDVDPFRPGFVRRLKQLRSKGPSRSQSINLHWEDESYAKPSVSDGGSARKRSRTRRSRSSDGPIACEFIKRFFLFFMRPPQTTVEKILWSLLLPITFTTTFFSQLVICYVAACVDLVKNTKPDWGGGYGYGGGGGLFDEVSDARRADIEFLFGARK